MFNRCKSYLLNEFLGLLHKLTKLKVIWANTRAGFGTGVYVFVSRRTQSFIAKKNRNVCTLPSAITVSMHKYVQRLCHPETSWFFLSSLSGSSILEVPINRRFFFASFGSFVGARYCYTHSFNIFKYIRTIKLYAY